MHGNELSSDNIVACLSSYANWLPACLPHIKELLSNFTACTEDSLYKDSGGYNSSRGRSSSSRGGYNNNRGGRGYGTGRGKSQKYCDHCGRNNHTRETCFEYIAIHRATKQEIHHQMPTLLQI
ncbi:unnamed protein product [Cuscuta europaea]|uniref:Uncharacterized protein n=1 Tax=Cuscuta europaea TaxID=41803 RepID=A0A9P0ZUS5_CUSEU|nr:unnamed protein product [Cuscuta europaea]